MFPPQTPPVPFRPLLQISGSAAAYNSSFHLLFPVSSDAAATPLVLTQNTLFHKFHRLSRGTPPPPFNTVLCWNDDFTRPWAVTECRSMTLAARGQDWALYAK